MSVAIYKKQTHAKVVAPENIRPGKRPHLAILPSTSRVVGYARVSTVDQLLDVQITALKKAGATDLFVEKLSALNAKRPMFNLMMKFVERGDTVLFHSLSRMGRDVSQILGILKELNGQGVAWRSLTEPHLDHMTAAGRLMVNVTGALAQFERDQIIERTTRGMEACRNRGQYLGRPCLVTPADVRKMKRMRFKQKIDVKVIAKQFGVRPSTVYSYTNRK